MSPSLGGRGFPNLYRNQPNFHGRLNGAECAMVELPMHEFDGRVKSGQESNHPRPVVAVAAHVVDAFEYIRENEQRT